MNALIRGRDTVVGTDRAGRTAQVQTGEDGITGSWFKIVWLRNLSIYQEPSNITAPTRRSHPNRPSLTQEPLPRSRPPPGRSLQKSHTLNISPRDAQARDLLSPDPLHYPLRLAFEQVVT
jgi:hypothetical protein